MSGEGSCRTSSRSSGCAWTLGCIRGGAEGWGSAASRVRRLQWFPDGVQPSENMGTLSEVPKDKRSVLDGAGTGHGFDCPNEASEAGNEFRLVRRDTLRDEELAGDP